MLGSLIGDKIFEEAWETNSRQSKSSWLEIYVLHVKENKASLMKEKNRRKIEEGCGGSHHMKVQKAKKQSKRTSSSLGMRQANRSLKSRTHFNAIRKGLYKPMLLAGNPRRSTT
ncbi:hypothetical protein ACE6H2_001245 [Prunus campanulata]